MIIHDAHGTYDTDLARVRMAKALQDNMVTPREYANALKDIEARERTEAVRILANPERANNGCMIHKGT